MPAAVGTAFVLAPVLLVGVALVLLCIAVARSLRDDAVLDALRAEVRSLGEVHLAVHEARAAGAGRPAAR